MTLKIPSTVYEGVQKVVTVYTPSSIKKQQLYVILPSANAAMTAAMSGWIGKLPAARDPSLDITFDCAEVDAYGNEDAGIPSVTLSLLGTWLNTAVSAGAGSVTLTLLGSYIPGVTASGLMNLTITLKPNDSFNPFVSVTRKNWVKWSDIGSLSFTIGRSNVAGERPLDWNGYVYSVRKLGKKVCVYGENGVSMLSPVGGAYGLDTFYRIGLKGKHAITGDDTKHYFVDNAGHLIKLSEGLDILDYSEHLSQLNSSLVMNYDALNNLVYICDGVLGFVYSVDGKSLGKCSGNIAGLGYQSKVQYVTAPATITTDAFEICTDIYDLGARVGKTIYSLELGTDLITGLYAAIDYRRDKSAAFVQTPWYSVASTGRVFITAWGREFRFRVKTLTYEYFELDYIKINGVADAY